MIQWRNEGENIKPGLSIYHYKDTGSIGFTLSLDRWYIWLRYSKKKKKFFGCWERRDPLAWRMLKAKNDDNN